MNKLANARSDAAFSKSACQNSRCKQFTAAFPVFLVEVYFSKSQMNSLLSESLPLARNFLYLCKIFMEARRNILRWNFVYTGAAPYRAAQGEIQKKNPAVAAAGS